MPAYQYKTQEGKDKHNAWRREYYRKNKERIRARDNANARKRRRENKELGITPKKYTRKKIDVRNNPDKERIREAIRAEESSAQAAQNCFLKKGDGAFILCCTAMDFCAL